MTENTEQLLKTNPASKDGMFRKQVFGVDVCNKNKLTEETLKNYLTRTNLHQKFRNLGDTIELNTENVLEFTVDKFSSLLHSVFSKTDTSIANALSTYEELEDWQRLHHYGKVAYVKAALIANSFPSTAIYNGLKKSLNFYTEVLDSLEDNSFKNKFVRKITLIDLHSAVMEELLLHQNETDYNISKWNLVIDYDELLKEILFDLHNEESDGGIVKKYAISSEEFKGSITVCILITTNGSLEVVSFLTEDLIS